MYKCEVVLKKIWEIFVETNKKMEYIFQGRLLEVKSKQWIGYQFPSSPGGFDIICHGLIWIKIANNVIFNLQIINR